MKKNRSFISGISSMAAMALLLFILPQCAKYKPTPLPHPTGHSQETDGVKVVSRQLTEQEIKACFDTREAAQKYSAVQVSVKNNRNKPIVLSANTIDMPIESTKSISNKIYRNTAGRAGGYGVASLVLWPLIIPAAVDGAKSSNANYKIDHDMKVKVLGQNETIVIEPHNAINKVFFVEKESIKDEFSLTLVEQDSSKEIGFVCKA